MLTAAVRDLHRCYPKRFITDVRTLCPELWENNPYLIPLTDDDPQVEQIECRYPLINRCNQTPYHCLHGFIEFFNDHLRLAVKPVLTWKTRILSLREVRANQPLGYGGTYVTKSPTRIAVLPVTAPRFDAIATVFDLAERMRAELEQFFLAATFFEKKNVRMLGWDGPERARAFVEESIV